MEVILNTNFFEQRMLGSEVYRTFVVVISMEGIDEKHKLNLEKSNYTILSNKKSVGKLNPHFVKAKPSIRELASTGSNLSSNITNSSGTEQTKKLVEELATNESQLDFHITQFSNVAAKAEIKVPKLVGVKFPEFFLI